MCVCVCVCLCVAVCLHLSEEHTCLATRGSCGCAADLFLLHACCVCFGFSFFVLFFCAYRTAEVSYSACAFRALCLAPVTPSAHAPPERMSDFKCCFMFVCERES